MKKNIALATIAITLLTACGGKKGGDKVAELAALKKQQIELNEKIVKLESDLEVSNSDVKQFEVGVQTLHRGPFKTCIQVQGSVDALQNVNVSPQAGGIVKYIYVKAGQSVKSGQLLALIDDEVVKQGIEELQTQLSFAKTMYEKQKNLWEQKIGTEVQYINAKTQKDALERKLSTTKAQLDLYKVKAPVAGVVDAMDLRVGQAYAMGMPGIKIVNNQNMKVKAMVTDAYVGRVKSKNVVTVHFPDLGVNINTQLSYISRSIDPYSRSFAVEVLLPQGSQYSQNMMAVLDIVDYQNSNALVLPITMIQKSEKGTFVYLAQGNVARKTIVQTGRMYQGKIEILSGLKEGDKVIVTGLSEINDGDIIKY